MEIIASIMVRGYTDASNKAAAYHARLDSIQRFFIAHSAYENMEEKIKDSTRAKLIKKLMDLPFPETEMP